LREGKASPLFSLQRVRAPPLCFFYPPRALLGFPAVFFRENSPPPLSKVQGAGFFAGWVLLSLLWGFLLGPPPPAGFLLEGLFFECPKFFQWGFFPLPGRIFWCWVPPSSRPPVPFTRCFPRAFFPCQPLGNFSRFGFLAFLYSLRGPFPVYDPAL